MTKQFAIKKICTENNRPPYSHKVEEYFEGFVHDNILKPFGIILNDEYSIILSIMIFRKDESSVEGISIYEPDIISEEKIKFYPAGIYLEDIYAGATIMENVVSLYFQVISLFFLSEYHVVKHEYMLSLKEKIDWNYLLSLPYPAPEGEQHYVGVN